jgi:hypothetical protein
VAAWVFLYGKSFLRRPSFAKPDIVLSVLILVGTFLQLSAIWLNGIVLSNGLVLCCGLPDTVYHLALNSELVTQFPPHEPGISGMALQNYHYLSNLAVADLVRVFNLPLIATSYQYMSVLFSLLLGLSALVLANLLQFTRAGKIWLLFLLFFYGDIIFLLSFLNGKGINFLYTTLENAQSLWISPPRFYAIVVFLAGLSLFTLWLKKKDVFTGIIMAVVFASLIGLKIYIGAIMLAGLGVLGVIFLVKKEYKMLLPIFLFYLVSVALFLPANSNAGGLYFSGFWRFEDFIVQPSLGLSSMELARQVYYQHNNFIRVWLYDLYFGLLYIIFSAGVLTLGFFQTKDSLKSLSAHFTITLSVGLLATCATGFFFLQKTGGSNSGQFLNSIYIIGVIYAALGIAWWLAKLPRKAVFVVGGVLLVLASTRVIHDSSIRIVSLLKITGPSVDNNTIDALKYFSKSKDNNTVLMYEEISFECLLLRIVSSSSAYACALGAPGDRGVNLEERIAVRKMILYGEDVAKSRQTLKANKISYIYMPTTEVKASNVERLNLQKTYENKNVVIYKVL